MIFRPKPEELEFNRLNSRFKLIVYFKNRTPITHYGQERYGSTVKQIQFRHIRQVMLDREKGLKDCIDRLGLCVDMYGSYETAIIYDRHSPTKMRDGTSQDGREIRKYIKGKLIEWARLELPENEKRILTNVVYHQEGKRLSYTLEPVARLVDKIDFKSEVAAALARQNKI